MTRPTSVSEPPPEARMAAASMWGGGSGRVGTQPRYGGGTKVLVVSGWTEVYTRASWRQAFRQRMRVSWPEPVGQNCLGKVAVGLQGVSGVGCFQQRTTWRLAQKHTWEQNCHLVEDLGSTVQKEPLQLSNDYVFHFLNIDFFPPFLISFLLSSLLSFSFF